MTVKRNWRDGVSVVRGKALEDALRGPGRATAFDFAGGKSTWIGTAVNLPGTKTGTHNHGHHAIVLYVVRGRSEIRWGERLEYQADIGPGDFAYFTPHVPHQERNPSDTEAVEFVVVRNDSERIVVQMDDRPVADPEVVC